MKFWKFISQPLNGMMILIFFPLIILNINFFLLDEWLGVSSFDFYLKLISGTAVLFGVPMALYNLRLANDRREDEIVKRDEERSARQREKYKKDEIDKVKIPEIILPDQLMVGGGELTITPFNFYSKIEEYLVFNFLNNDLGAGINSMMEEVEVVKFHDLNKDEMGFVSRGKIFCKTLPFFMGTKILPFFTTLFNIIEEIKKDRILIEADKEILISTILNDYFHDYLKYLYRVGGTSLGAVFSTTKEGNVTRVSIFDDLNVPSRNSYKEVIAGYEDIENKVLQRLNIKKTVKDLNNP